MPRYSVHPKTICTLLLLSACDSGESESSQAASAASSADAVAAAENRQPEAAAGVQQAQTDLDARRKAILEDRAENRYLTTDATDSDGNSKTHPLLDNRDNVQDFSAVLTAKIIASEEFGTGSACVTSCSEGYDGESICDYANFLNCTDPSLFNAFSGVGTHFEEGPCGNQGDYDFALIDYLRVVLTDKRYGEPLNGGGQVIIDSFLTEDDAPDYRQYRISCGGFGIIKIGDTENHILMINVARYLTRQLKGKLDASRDHHLMTELLQEYVKHGFYEANSRPYQRYTVHALELLHTYAKDESVKTAAQIVLDIVSAQTGLQMSGMRRFAPFRRRMENWGDIMRGSEGAWEADQQHKRLAFLSGDTDVLEATGEWESGDYGIGASFAAASDYRMDDVVLDVVLRAGGSPRYYVGYAEHVETYATSENVTISGAGTYAPAILPSIGPYEPSATLNSVVDRINLITDEMIRPTHTTVIPRRDYRDLTLFDTIRFEGRDDDKARAGNCVAPSFACGLTPRIPSAVADMDDSRCKVKSGDWTFYDLDSPECQDWGFYLASYVASCPPGDFDCNRHSITDEYGLLEIYDSPSANFDLGQFADAVFEKNPMSFRPSGVETYTTMQGDVIDFEINPRDVKKTNIRRVNDGVHPERYDGYALAEGNTMQSAGDGLYYIVSEDLNRRLVLDFRDARNPKRFTEPLAE